MPCHVSLSTQLFYAIFYSWWSSNIEPRDQLSCGMFKTLLPARLAAADCDLRHPTDPLSAQCRHHNTLYFVFGFQICICRTRPTPIFHCHHRTSLFLFVFCIAPTTKLTTLKWKGCRWLFIIYPLSLPKCGGVLMITHNHNPLIFLFNLSRWL